jgi:hypothetical protein
MSLVLDTYSSEGVPGDPVHKHNLKDIHLCAGLGREHIWCADLSSWRSSNAGMGKIMGLQRVHWTTRMQLSPPDSQKEFVTHRQALAPAVPDVLSTGGYVCGYGSIYSDIIFSSSCDIGKLILLFVWSDTWLVSEKYCSAWRWVVQFLLGAGKWGEFLFISERTELYQWTNIS